MSESSGLRTVQLFATCLVETIRPAVGMAVARVLEQLGVAVQVSNQQTCCGQPAFNAGAWDEARAMARHTLDTLEQSEASIVVPSGSCTDMILHRYGELLQDDAVYAAKAVRVAARTHEFSQFVVEKLKAPALGRCVDRTLVYHPSCHLSRGLGIREAPQQLLNGIEGAQCVPLQGADECCGFGGLFSVEMSDFSSAMLKRKLDSIIESGADTVVACDAGCLLQIEGGLHRRGARVSVCHLAEILAEQV